VNKLALLLMIFLSGILPVRAQDITPQATSEATATSIYEEMLPMFDYDQNAPLGIQELSSQHTGTVTVKDITYPSPVDGHAIAAYLIVPDGGGPFPAVMYVHWYEPSADNSNRTEFRQEAIQLAEQGAVSLLPATMWSEPTWFNSGRTLGKDYQNSINQVIEMRRGLDVLTAQSNVDTARMAYVGHDFGAMYGSVLAGVDRRPIAYVLIAGTYRFSDWYLLGARGSDAQFERYKAQMAPLDPTVYIAHAAPAAVLFQFGTQDGYVPQSAAQTFFDAASDPKEMKSYDSGHDMSADQIQADRLDFLRVHLGLSS
jgi:dienelactone hydrolase